MGYTLDTDKPAPNGDPLLPLVCVAVRACPGLAAIAVVPRRGRRVCLWRRPFNLASLVRDAWKTGSAGEVPKCSAVFSTFNTNTAAATTTACATTTTNTT